MTGLEFNKLMKDNGYSQTTLAARWGVVRQTVGNCCKAEQVDPLYAEAIRALAFEKQAIQLINVIKLFSNVS